MKFIKLSVVAILAAGLAGCFTSDQTWLTDDNSVAPYEAITFSDSDSSDSNRLVRQGKTYVAKSDDDTIIMRFMPLERPGWYLTQVTGDDEGEPQHLYAVLDVDIDAGTADTYMAIGDDDDTGPGLRACEDYMVCIDDLDAYIAHTMAAVDAGAEPNGTFKISVE